jgi:hypothetical protein
MGKSVEEKISIIGPWKPSAFMYEFISGEICHARLITGD